MAGCGLLPLLGSGAPLERSCAAFARCQALGTGLAPWTLSKCLPRGRVWLDMFWGAGSRQGLSAGCPELPLRLLHAGGVVVGAGGLHL